MFTIRTAPGALAALLLSASSAYAADCPKDALSSPAAGTTCACPTAGITNGWVYGTGRYTADSYPCTAAIHAGKITASGGEITFYTGGSCPAFASTTANGITSSSWGKFDQTFAFETPLPDCALQQTAAAATPAPAAAPSEPAATPAPATPPPTGADEPTPELWQKRADAYAAIAPDPLTGWTATAREGVWSNSGMTGYSVTGGRIYKAEGPSMQHDLTIFVFGTPDGTPYPRYEAIWTAAATKTKIAGRDAVRIEESGEHMIVYRNEAGVYLVVGRLGSHETTDAEMDAYAAAIDFAKFDKLPAK